MVPDGARAPQHEREQMEGWVALPAAKAATARLIATTLIIPRMKDL
ncbi:hypothetical protein BRCON_0137 [Candidatus Sumerlaea chitinivorans]|jgi:hypothetical protein|uniref:Uncharacterized protein n=1 Tax=Sumerlaea chitinivorans TaxID=2250252 RepID=A0A2Z4Y1K7_SUMC1|nr:hypothetical protein BRCON_0137 [Candidatus Sumerlaea chitinivorans]